MATYPTYPSLHMHLFSLCFTEKYKHLGRHIGPSLLSPSATARNSESFISAFAGRRAVLSSPFFCGVKPSSISFFFSVKSNPVVHIENCSQSSNRFAHDQYTDVSTLILKQFIDVETLVVWPAGGAVCGSLNGYALGRGQRCVAKETGMIWR